MPGFYSPLKFVFVVLSSIICFNAESPAASESDIRFLRGLADRGLFDSVEYFCTKEFQKPSEPIPEKYFLASELIRSRSRQMLLETPERQQEIQASLDELEKRFAGTPDDFSCFDDSLARLSFQFQRAIATYSWGDWQRLDADVAVGHDRDDKLKQARRTLLDSLNRFETCLENVLALRKKSGPNPGLAQEQRLLALERSVRFQQGLAQMSYALTFPVEQNEQPDSNRSYSLNRAVEILTKIASLRIDDPMIVQSRIKLATCYRLLGNLTRCHEILSQLNQDRYVGNLQFQAELLRYSIEVGDLDIATQNFQQGQTVSASDPDFDLAGIELLLARTKRLRIRSAEQDENTKRQAEKQLSNDILQLIRKVENESGPYWGRRARMLLSAGENPERLENPIDPEMLVMLAEDRFRTGHHAEAVALFRQAGRSYELAGNQPLAFACCRSSLAILANVLEQATISELVSEDEKKTCKQQLVEQLRNVSTRFFEQNEASELHLKAIDLTADDLLEDKTRIDEYLGLLREHAGTWPDSVKIPPLLLRAASLLEQQEKPGDALELISRISNRQSSVLDALDSARRCFNEMGSNLSGSDGNELFDFLIKKADWFKKRLPIENEHWNEADIRCAFSASEALLQAAIQATDLKAKDDLLRQTEQLLRLAFTKGENWNASDKASFHALLITTLNESNQKREAAELLQSFNADLRELLTPREQTQFKQVQARLLSDIGNTQGAVDLLAELLKQDPNDLSHWKLLAEILSKQPDSESLTKALRIWTRIEQHSKKGSEFWWSAREGIIDVLIKQGKTTEARKSYDLLQLLYPDFGNDERKRKLQRKLGQIVCEKD